MSCQKVLITGMSGLIGQVVANRLKSTCDLSALNRRLVEGVTCHQADISDLEAIRAAFDDIDVGVHLAAAIQADWNGFLQSNIIGTYNVFEAARQAANGVAVVHGVIPEADARIAAAVAVPRPRPLRKEIME